LLYRDEGSHFATHETVKNSAKSMCGTTCTRIQRKAISACSKRECAACSSIALRSTCTATSRNSISGSITVAVGYGDIDRAKQATEAGGRPDIMVTVGGVIPPQDWDALRDAGVPRSSRRARSSPTRPSA
jgi:hypothetical protein